MNPLTNTKNQNVMNRRELSLGYTGTASSWHRQYKDSAWIFVGGLHYDLTEGDVLCVFSQYGEIVNVNLVRDRKTGVSKGFAFLCYEDQRSTVLATDNLNGIKLVGRTIKVDHVEQYKVPKDGTTDFDLGEHKKDSKDPDMVADFVREHGCGPEVAQQLTKIQKNAKELQKMQKCTCRHANREPHSGSRSHRSRSRDRKSLNPNFSSHHRRKHDENNAQISPPRRNGHRSEVSPPRISHRDARKPPCSQINQSSNLSPPRKSNHMTTTRRIQCSPEVLQSPKRPTTMPPSRRARHSPSISPPRRQIKQESPEQIRRHHR